MEYNSNISHLWVGYNPFTNHLLISWLIPKRGFWSSTSVLLAQWHRDKLVVHSSTPAARGSDQQQWDNQKERPSGQCFVDWNQKMDKWPKKHLICPLSSLQLRGYCHSTVPNCFMFCLASFGASSKTFAKDSSSAQSCCFFSQKKDHVFGVQILD